MSPTIPCPVALHANAKTVGIKGKSREKIKYFSFIIKIKYANEVAKISETASCCGRFL